MIRPLKRFDSFAISYKKQRLSSISLRGSTAAFGAAETYFVEMKEPPSIAADIAELESELAEQETEFGPSHPSIAEALGKLGRLQLVRGDITAADTNLHRALTIREKAFGHDSLEAARSLNDLAAILAHT